MMVSTGRSFGCGLGGSTCIMSVVTTILSVLSCDVRNVSLSSSVDELDNTYVWMVSTRLREKIVTSPETIYI